RIEFVAACLLHSTDDTSFQNPRPVRAVHEQCCKTTLNPAYRHFTPKNTPPVEPLLHCHRRVPQEAQERFGMFRHAFPEVIYRGVQIVDMNARCVPMKQQLECNSCASSVGFQIVASRKPVQLHGLCDEGSELSFPARVAERRVELV